MEEQEAFEMISRVCGGVSMNLEGHKQVQSALAIVSKELFNKEVNQQEEEKPSSKKEEGKTQSGS